MWKEQKCHLIVIITETKANQLPQNPINSPPFPCPSPASSKSNSFSLTYQTERKMVSFPSLSREKMLSGNKIRHMLRRWRKKAAAAARGTPSDVPSGHLADVPSGHLAVCVGASNRRFVVRTTYLNHPAFGKLLDQAQEEYGYANSGPLAIPCDEVLFEEFLGYLGRTESGKSARFTNLEDFQKCRIDARSNLEFWPESRPLLNGLPD